LFVLKIVINYLPRYAMHWMTSRFSIDLSQPKVMGIVNVTPDSFSDGGQNYVLSAAMRHGEQLIKDGADILDIGGESTRPGAQALPLKEELSRVLPVVREAVRLGVPISVDTYKPQVMQAVLDLGADIINDVWALRWDGTESAAQPLSGLQVVAQHPNCGVCLMHMHLEPRTMQLSPMDGDVVQQVLSFLDHQSDVLIALGLKKTQIMIDPGIGFGKTVAQNFALLARQQELLSLGLPLLAGWSRKSSLAAVVGVPPGALAPQHRVVASVAAALLSVERGASVVRVHDVLETVQALKVLSAIK
jgi:dihydropteroate synthase